MYYEDNFYPIVYSTTSEIPRLQRTKSLGIYFEQNNSNPLIIMTSSFVFSVAIFTAPYIISATFNLTTSVLSSAMGTLASYGYKQICDKYQQSSNPNSNPDEKIYIINDTPNDNNFPCCISSKILNLPETIPPPTNKPIRVDSCMYVSNLILLHPIGSPQNNYSSIPLDIKLSPVVSIPVSTKRNKYCYDFDNNNKFIPRRHSCPNIDTTNNIPSIQSHMNTLLSPKIIEITDDILSLSSGSSDDLKSISLSSSNKSLNNYWNNSDPTCSDFRMEEFQRHMQTNPLDPYYISQKRKEPQIYFDDDHVSTSSDIMKINSSDSHSVSSSVFSWEDISADRDKDF